MKDAQLIKILLRWYQTHKRDEKDFWPDTATMELSEAVQKYLKAKDDK